MKLRKIETIELEPTTPFILTPPSINPIISRLGITIGNQVFVGKRGAGQGNVLV